MSGTLAKAKLIRLDDKGSPLPKDKFNIIFMYNPTEITLSRSLNIEQSSGSQTPTGSNKTSFKHPNPYSLKISNVILDTYEQGVSVLPLIALFKHGVEFSDANKSLPQPAPPVRNRQAGTSAQPSQADKKRPPLYLFTWGNQQYLRCFMKQVSFKLTMFLPNGEPVRAVLDLSLEQATVPSAQGQQGASSPSSEERNAGGRPILFY
jgi:hypothetical protein